jgi:hypothetical protein
MLILVATHLYPLNASAHACNDYHVYPKTLLRMPSNILPAMCLFLHIHPAPPLAVFCSFSACPCKGMGSGIVCIMPSFNGITLEGENLGGKEGLCFLIYILFLKSAVLTIA